MDEGEWEEEGGKGRHDRERSVGPGQQQLHILIPSQLPWLFMPCRRVCLRETVEIPSPYPKKPRLN
jgi:hypothetical protein